MTDINAGIFFKNEASYTTVSGVFDNFTSSFMSPVNKKGVVCYNTFGQETFSSFRYKAARICDRRTISADTSGTYDIPIGYSDYTDSTNFILTTYSLDSTKYPLEATITTNYTVSGIRYVRVSYDYDSSTFSDSASTRYFPTADTEIMVCTP
jgi:hypothetical protein